MREPTAEEKAKFEELAQQRAALKEVEFGRAAEVERKKAVQDRVVAALQARTSAAVSGARDLTAFVRGNAEMEEQASRNFARFASLFGLETGSSNDALLGYASSCKSMQKLHADLKEVLSAQELKRAEESMAAVEERSRALVASSGTLVSDLASARDKVSKALTAQEVCWEDAARHAAAPPAAQTPESDPWLAGMRYQAACKTLEAVEAAHAPDLPRLVADLREVDQARLETMKTVLKSYAEGKRELLRKALVEAENLCSMLDKIQPEADCPAFLQAAEVRDEDMEVKEGQGEAAGGAGAGGSLGVWINDAAVRACQRCSQTFSLMRRKHHCRRCGHVFCDKCSGRQASLPPSFGLGNTPQRVCETCFELIQSGAGGDAAGGAAGSEQSEIDFEVLREGPLLKKKMIGPATTYQARHFVCTRAGFLHYFENKQSGEAPKGSIPLLAARISPVEDDACAIAIEVDDAGAGASFFMKSKNGKTKHVVRSAAGSLDRDAWMAALLSCSRLVT